MKRTRSCPICRVEIKQEDDKAIVPNWGLQVRNGEFAETFESFSCAKKGFFLYIFFSYKTTGSSGQVQRATTPSL